MIRNISKQLGMKNRFIKKQGFRVMGVGESESDGRFGVSPISDVLKVEHCRFSALPCNKKSVLTGFNLNDG